MLRAGQSSYVLPKWVNEILDVCIEWGSITYVIRPLNVSSLEKEMRKLHGIPFGWTRDGNILSLFPRPSKECGIKIRATDHDQKVKFYLDSEG